jgi:7-cyano-7-deazaguanine synthase in queuosine biosynthesis
MGITRLVATPDAAAAAAASRSGGIGVALYHSGTAQLAGLGASLPLAAQKTLPQPPSQIAWDFLTIALAVFAADRFVLRAQAEDAWTRVLDLDIALAEPSRWQPQATRLAAAFRFLTGDIWSVTFRSGGQSRPTFQGRLTDRDCVCLFSGGLDSLLGAMTLRAEGRRPLLVSQGSPKEITPQKTLSREIGLREHRFDGRVNERWRPPYEPSTRSRSILFFAYGAIAASALGTNEVIVPENALIAINPPFTRRRTGSLSTRTTHPHFLTELSAIWADVGLNLSLRNPFATATKGEMLASVTHPNLAQLAATSYSCGKGKRINAQCGRCVPCLIRRAAFHSAGVTDGTRYKWDILTHSASADDVLATRTAAARYDQSRDPFDLERWAAMAGPLPRDQAVRDPVVAAVGRGVEELKQFLATVRWPR